MPGLQDLVSFVFKGLDAQLLNNTVAVDYLKSAYEELNLSDDDFAALVTAIRQVMIKSKKVKIPVLKKIILAFSEFRTLLTYKSPPKSLLESHMSLASINSYMPLYKP